MTVQVLIFLLSVTLGYFLVNADSASDLDDPNAWKGKMNNNGFDKRDPRSSWSSRSSDLSRDKRDPRSSWSSRSSDLSRDKKSDSRSSWRSWRSWRSSRFSDFSRDKRHSSSSSSSSSDSSHHLSMFKYWKKLNDCVCRLDKCNVDMQEKCRTDFSELEDTCASLSDQGYKMIRTECLSMCIKIVTEDNDTPDPQVETFQIAKLACETDGGRLVILNTLLRNALVQEEVLSIGDPGKFLMIGGKYVSANNEFLWRHDDSVFTFSDIIEAVNKGDSDCIYLQDELQYRWSQSACSDHTRGYICEIAP